eukprot:s262_g10.t1
MAAEYHKMEERRAELQRQNNELNAWLGHETSRAEKARVPQDGGKKSGTAAAEQRAECMVGARNKSGRKGLDKSCGLYGLQLFSILGALGNRRAIQVKMVCVEGVRFNTQRNEEALLNLWEALHLDDGANEATIVHGAHQVGGLDHPHMVKQLHSEAAEQAGRKAPRDHRLRRQDQIPRYSAGRPFASPTVGSACPLQDRASCHAQEMNTQVCVIGAKLWLFDLLTTDRRWRLVEPKDTRMEVAALAFPWETLSKRDPRRDGHGDGVKGVYLGELVWVLIAQLLPRVLESSPRNLLKTALFAVGFGAWDASVIMGAKAFELALDAKYCLANVMPCIPTTLPRQPSLSRCFVHVHLICGRGLVREQDQYCNVLVRLELKNPQTPEGQVADVALAPLRMWTKFCLGPATSTSSLVRVRCFHCKARHMMSTKCDGLLGQVLVPLSQLLGCAVVYPRILAESRRTKDGAMVRWFPLDAASIMVPRHGHLKLGFRLSGQAHLSQQQAMNPRSHSCVHPLRQMPDLMVLPVYWRSSGLPEIMEPKLLCRWDTARADSALVICGVSISG